MEILEEILHDVRYTRQEVGSIMRTVNETFTVVSRIEQKEDEILRILKSQPGVAVAVKTHFEKEK